VIDTIPKSWQKNFFSINNILWFILGQIEGQVVKKNSKTYTLPLAFIGNLQAILVYQLKFSAGPILNLSSDTFVFSTLSNDPFTTSPFCIRDIILGTAYIPKN
jgi:hypothetical protein